MVGSPVAHSLSPQLHTAAYAALGLPWTYDRIEIVPDALPAVLDGLGPEWAGLSLTMPLKQTVLPLLYVTSALALATGAANTLVLRDGRREGHNTDVAGLVSALREAGVDEVSASVVLGGGATAASAVAGLAELGDRAPVVLVRDPGRAGPLLAAAERLGVRPVVRHLAAEHLSGAQVVLNTTPAGALDGLAAGLPDTRGSVLLDVVYAPWPTALAAAWGGAVVHGVEMLLHQAAGQVQLMTGLPAPVPAMRAALAQALPSYVPPSATVLQ